MSCDDGGGSKETSKKAVEFEVAELNPVVTPTDKPNLRHTAFHTHQDSLVAVADNLKETYSFKVSAPFCYESDDCYSPSFTGSILRSFPCFYPMDGPPTSRCPCVY